MKLLIVARHGRRDDRGRLSDEGRRGVESLARAIKKRFKKPGKLIILSSPQTRAMDTAKVFSQQLRVDVCKYHELGESAYADVSQRLANNAVNAVRKWIEYDTVIVVTHYALTWYIPNTFAVCWRSGEEKDMEKYGRFGECIPFPPADHACANILNMETGEVIANFGKGRSA